MGEASRAGSTRGKSKNVYKGKKGFGYGLRGGGAAPGNTTVRELLSDERFLEAVLSFLGTTRVGCLKSGCLIRDRRSRGIEQES